MRRMRILTDTKRNSIVGVGNAMRLLDAPALEEREDMDICPRTPVRGCHLEHKGSVTC